MKGNITNILVKTPPFTKLVPHVMPFSPFIGLLELHGVRPVMFDICYH